MQIWLLWHLSGKRYWNLVEERALLLAVLLQVASPVISLPPPLAHSSSCPLPPSSREIIADALSILSEACDFQACNLGDASVTVGVRGLFLLAYQEPPLSHLLPGADAWFARDYSVPKLYADVVGRDESLTVSEASGDSSGGGIGSRGGKRERGVTVVGFISSFFFRHSVGRLLAQVIIQLSQRFPSLEVHVIDLSHPSETRRDDDLYVALEAGV
jgi:hypothetical protein